MRWKHEPTANHGLRVALSCSGWAELMGLPDDYILPDNYNDAYHLAGDGVVVPVVRHVAEHLLDAIVPIKKKIYSSAA